MYSYPLNNADEKGNLSQLAMVQSSKPLSDDQLQSLMSKLQDHASKNGGFDKLYAKPGIIDADAMLGLNAPVKPQKSFGSKLMDNLKSDIVDSVMPLAIPIRHAQEIAGSPLVRNFTNMASAGLQEPIAAGLSAGIAYPMDTQGRSLGDLYHGFRAHQANQLGQIQSENPVQSTIGEIAGAVAPGSLFSRAFNNAGKLVGIGSDVLPASAAGASLLNPLAKLGKIAAQGALSNVAFQGLNPESGIYQHGGLQNAATQGAEGNLLGNAVGTALSYAPKLIKQGATHLPFGIGGFIKSLGNSSFESDLGNLASSMNAEDIQGAGKTFQNVVGKANDQITEPLNNFVNPVLKQYGGETVSAQPLRDSINEQLSKFGVLKPNGAIDSEMIENLPNGAPKNFLKSLTSYSQNIQNNPTLSQLEILRKGLGEIPDFDATYGKSFKQPFAQVYGGARESVNNAIENFVGPDQAQAFSQARQNYSAVRPIMEYLTDIARNDPEKIVKGAGPLANFTGSKIDEALQANPELKGAFQSPIMAFLNMTQKTPEMLTKTLNKYGTDTLGDLFGPDTLAQLQKLGGKPGAISSLMKNFLTQGPQTAITAAPAMSAFDPRVKSAMNTMGDLGNMFFPSFFVPAHQ